jgi:predicted RNA binding protein YcfA (HicA-like mRNA interferase family)
MPKPKTVNKLPVLKTKELERVYKRLGFKCDEKKHAHIILKNPKGKKVVLKKGNKDVKPLLLKTIIEEIAQKTGKTEKEIIEFIMNNK